jgi:hypothetical protein
MRVELGHVTGADMNHLHRKLWRDDEARTTSSKMKWKRLTEEQWMQAGFVAVFFLGIVSTIIILAQLK